MIYMVISVHTKKVNRIIAAILFLLVFVEMYGGLGALMAFGYFGESIAKALPWGEFFLYALFFTWCAAWVLGVVVIAFRFKRILRGILSPTELVGWCDFVIFVANIVFVGSFFSLLMESEFVYFGHVIAGGLYAAGFAAIGFETLEDN
jgi:hypothetical protein